MTSLLSPLNLRKMEQKNLYQKMINSFYTPAAPAKTNSAIVNPRNLFQTKFADGSSMPANLHLRPQDVSSEVVVPSHLQQAMRDSHLNKSKSPSSKSRYVISQC